MNLVVACANVAAAIANFAVGNALSGILFLVAAGIWVHTHLLQRRNDRGLP